MVYTTLLLLLLASFSARGGEVDYVYTNEKQKSFACTAEFNDKQFSKAEIEATIQLVTHPWDEDVTTLINSLCVKNKEQRAKDQGAAITSLKTMIRQLDQMKVAKPFEGMRLNKLKWFKYRLESATALFEFAASEFKRAKLLKAKLNGKALDKNCLELAELAGATKENGCTVALERWLSCVDAQFGPALDYGGRSEDPESLKRLFTQITCE